MHVTVEIISSVPLVPGSDSLEIELKDQSTVRDLLTVLVASFGENVARRLIDPNDGEPFVTFIVNREQAELNCQLAPGDCVVILPPIGGG